MNAPTLNQLVPILQLAIGPVILISGVGLLLLTITNRLGRVVDRSRVLARELALGAAGATAERHRPQVDILYQRAAILRLSITLLAITVLSAAVLILLLFVSVLLHIETGGWIIAVFSLGQIALIGSIAAFIRDMNLSLAALRLELGR